MLAQALRALKPGGVFAVLAAKDKGGSRLRKELEAFGCVVEDGAPASPHLPSARPETLSGLDQAIAEGGPRFVEGLGLWTQPGVFSWDRLDPGTALLLRAPARPERPRRRSSAAASACWRARCWPRRRSSS